MLRPGISNEKLAAAGIINVDAETAFGLCGIKESGLWIPYHRLGGEEMGTLKPFGRLRLDTPRGDKKYHQEAESGVHPYLPPGLNELLCGNKFGEMVIVEGEFKALSLVEARVPAIGISGFYGFQTPCSFGVPLLLAEIYGILQQARPERLLFLGDNDTALNYQFADATVQLMQRTDRAVSLPRIPLNAPGKGIDDCRQALGERFPAFWRQIQDAAVTFDLKANADIIALALIQRERENLASMANEQRQALRTKLIRFAAGFKDPLSADEMVELLVEAFRQKRRAVLKAVATERARMLREVSGTRLWSEGGDVSPDGRPRVVLPGTNREESEFARLIGGILCSSDYWFLRGGEIQVIDPARRGAIDAFGTLDPGRAITSLEKYVQVGNLKGDEFVPQSMSARTAATLVKADALKQSLPPIERILTFPLPIRYEGKIVWPSPGYNEAIRAWLSRSAPEVDGLTGLADGRELLAELLDGFCFADEQSIFHARAYILTPFCRGLLPRFNTRVPLFQFIANRPRAGKDYLAALTGLIYEGVSTEEPPILEDTAEFRKHMLSLVRAGRRRVHFANCRGHIANAALEQFITGETFSSRILGESENFTVENDVDISLSANVGLSSTADLVTRSRTIRLEFFDEDPNARQFPQPNLHRWVLANRDRFLSVFAMLVGSWERAGCPPGPTTFTSFPDWAAIVGGIMAVAGLGDPCRPEANQPVHQDIESEYWTHAFQHLANAKGTAWLRLQEVTELLLQHGLGWPPAVDATSEIGAKIAFSRKLRVQKGRIYGGIKLEINDLAKKTEEHRFRFSPTPEAGHPGNQHGSQS